MNALKNWIDRSCDRLCRWLYDSLPGSHSLAVTGGKLTGMGSRFMLPIDRRNADSGYLYMHNNVADKANSASAKGGSGNPAECGFWAYCHMNGQPCVWCNGKNSLTTAETKDFSKLCPKGKRVGAAWYGCCKGPNGAKLIAFADCCWEDMDQGGADLTQYIRACSWFKGICHNWPGAKNWCVDGTIKGTTSGPGGNQTVYYNTRQYFCTVAVDTGSDASCG